MNNEQLLRQSLENLIGIIKAHQLESLSCDRDGETYCNCLSQAVENAEKIIESTKK